MHGGGGGGGGGGIVKVAPKPNKGLSSKMIDFVEKVMVKFTYHNNHSSLPHHYLSGTFTPVSEKTPPTTNLLVEGHLLECLNGEFVRVGPNPKFTPVAGYNWFDGDGCVIFCSLTLPVFLSSFLEERILTYNFSTWFPVQNTVNMGKQPVSRYVRTAKLQLEEYFGGAKFFKLGDLTGLFGLIMMIMRMLRVKLKVLDISYGTGTGNTALTYHHGKLLALQEADKPCKLSPFVFTSGKKKKNKRGRGGGNANLVVIYELFQIISCLKHRTEIVLTAILRCPQSFGGWRSSNSWHAGLCWNNCLNFDFQEMMIENTILWKFDTNKKARFGVLPRYAKDELQIRWFELPSCFIFHNGVLVCFAILLLCQSVFHLFMKFQSSMPVYMFLIVILFRYGMRVNMKTGLASQKKLSASAVDFPGVKSLCIPSFVSMQETM
ncbi:hypothetical protein SO802_008335, partial [Lithocarpus litseifolius]